MPNIFREVRVLRQEGKLHKKLINSLRVQSIISGVLMAIVVFNIVFRAANPFIAIMVAATGFVLGLLVFSRMTAVSWNEKEETVQSEKMDKVGYVTLVLYILFEVGLRTFLNNSFPISATAFLLAGIFGTLFGRVVGTLIEIHRVYRSTHSK